MKTFNFHIPAPLRERLLAERERTGLSEAEIVRRALDEHLETREGRRPRDVRLAGPSLQNAL